MPAFYFLTQNKNSLKMFSLESQLAVLSEVFSSSQVINLFCKKVYRLFILSFLMPIAKAFLVPTRTTSFLPRVTPVIHQDLDPLRQLCFILLLR